MSMDYSEVCFIERTEMRYCGVVHYKTINTKLSCVVNNHEITCMPEFLSAALVRMFPMFPDEVAATTEE